VEKKYVADTQNGNQTNDMSIVGTAVTVVSDDTRNAPQAPTLNALPRPPIAEVSHSEAEARHLLKRTPSSYFLNQIYGLWFFLSWFFLTVIITHKVSATQYGIFAIALSAFNTVAYIVAFGFEDAITTYVPRVLAERGQATAAQFVRRLLILRLGVLVLSTVVMLFALPVLAALIALVPVKGAGDMASSLRSPTLLAHIIPIAFYVMGNGIFSLFSAVCAALMRMRIVLVISGLTQAVLLALGFVVLQLGFGVDGLLWLLAISSLLQSLAFVLWLAPFLFTWGAEYRQPLKPALKLGISAWLTNIVTGALFKQVSILLLGYFAISLVQIGYFNLSFQLADSANLLLVSGFAGVGGSALAAAFIGDNYVRLAQSWQVLIKIETLLAAPLLVFCLFNASNIAHALYGASFDPVGPLLAVFLFFNILVRVLGTTIHQSTLYVVRKPRLVVLGQWAGLVAVILIGIVLIPRFGPLGALLADGLAKTLTGALLLAFLWRELPRKYPLGFTMRFLLALTLAALPSILWHPSNHILLGISGTLFLLLCAGLLLWIKPLNAEDMEMICAVQPKLARYLQWFAHT
jgi:O-antigen/teichoic acid export membrane protein